MTSVKSTAQTGVKPQQTQKAAQQGAAKQKASDNDIIQEGKKQAGEIPQQPSPNNSAGEPKDNIGAGPGPDTKTASDAADQGAAQQGGDINGAETEARYQAAKTRYTELFQSEPPADSETVWLEKQIEEKEAFDLEEKNKAAAGQQQNTANNDIADAEYNRMKAVYLSTFSKEAPDDMNTEELKAAIDEELEQQQNEVKFKKEKAVSQAEDLQRKREKKYGKGFIIAMKGKEQGIFTAIAWRNLGANKEGWRQVIEEPEEIKRKK